MHPNFTLISGGQTGVDTAVLKVAFKFNIPYTGHVPHGFTKETGRISESYISSTLGKLIETESSDNAERTRLNSLEADGVITLSRGHEKDVGTLSEGTELGKKAGEVEGRDMYYVDLDTAQGGETMSSEVEKVQRWLKETNVERCVIGGPRESEASGIEDQAEAFLSRVFGEIAGNGWKSIRLEGNGRQRETIEPVLRDNRYTS